MLSLIYEPPHSLKNPPKIISKLELFIETGLRPIETHTRGYRLSVTGRHIASISGLTINVERGYIISSGRGGGAELRGSGVWVYQPKFSSVPGMRTKYDEFKEYHPLIRNPSGAFFLLVQPPSSSCFLHISKGWGVAAGKKMNAGALFFIHLSSPVVEMKGGM